MNSRTAIVLVVASLPMIVACGDAGGAGNPPASAIPAETNEIAVNVRTLPVPRTTLEEYLTISGPLRPLRGTDVSTEENGVVDEIPRDKGSYVEQGEVLLSLSRDLLAAELRAAEADLSLNEYNEERVRQLREAKQVSEQDLRRAQTELERAKAAVDAARIRWERAAVKAPYPGIVSNRYAEPGQLVTAGTPVMRVVDPFTLKLEAAVTEREVRWIRPGAEAALAVEGIPETRDGRVDWVSFEADPKTGKFRVEVHVDNPDLALHPGVVARAQVVKEVHEDVVVIPRDAILLRPEGDVVFVVEGDRARKREVELGRDQGLMTVVLSGLSEDEQLVVRGQRDLLDGSLVKVQQVATAPDGSTDDDPTVVRAAESFRPLRLDTEVERAAVDEDGNETR